MCSKAQIPKVDFALILGIQKLQTPLLGGVCRGKSKIFQGTISEHLGDHRAGGPYSSPESTKNTSLRQGVSMAAPKMGMRAES